MWEETIAKLRRYLSRGIFPSVAIKADPYLEDVIYGSLCEDCYRGTLEQYLTEHDGMWLLGRALERLEKGIPSTVTTPLKFAFPRRMGVGTYGWKYGPDVIEAALQCDVGFIDTAETYGFGRVEKALGNTLSNLRPVLIASKFSKQHMSRESVLSAFRRTEACFNDGTKFHYQLHWPNKQFGLYGTMLSLNLLLTAGKVQSIGVCNCSIDLLATLDDYSRRKLSTNQVRFSLFEPRANRILLPWCKEAGIVVLAYSPLGQDYKKVLKERDPKNYLAQKAKKLNCTIPQLLLAWILGQGAVPIFRTNNPDHLRSNMEAMLLELSPEDQEEMEEVINGNA